MDRCCIGEAGEFSNDVTKSEAADDGVLGSFSSSSKDSVSGDRMLRAGVAGRGDWVGVFFPMDGLDDMFFFALLWRLATDNLASSWGEALVWWRSELGMLFVALVATEEPFLDLKGIRLPGCWMMSFWFCILCWLLSVFDDFAPFLVCGGSEVDLCPLFFFQGRLIVMVTEACSAFDLLFISWSEIDGGGVGDEDALCESDSILICPGEAGGVTHSTHVAPSFGALMLASP
jgi:hypothetical protein